MAFSMTRSYMAGCGPADEAEEVPPGETKEANQPSSPGPTKANQPLPNRPLPEVQPDHQDLQRILAETKRINLQKIKEYDNTIAICLAWRRNSLKSSSALSALLKEMYQNELDQARTKRAMLTAKVSQQTYKAGDVVFLKWRCPFSNFF